MNKQKIYKDIRKNTNGYFFKTNYKTKKQFYQKN